jgi:hypothetical protein
MCFSFQHDVDNDREFFVRIGLNFNHSLLSVLYCTVLRVEYCVKCYLKKRIASRCSDFSCEQYTMCFVE